jgi:hypothetical protein
VLWEERDVDRVERDALHAISIIAPVPGQNAEFVGQCGPEQGRVVGVDGHQDASLVEHPKWVLGKAAHDAGANVARRAELEWNPIPREPLDQPGIVRGTDAMPDPLHPEEIE